MKIKMLHLYAILFILHDSIHAYHYVKIKTNANLLLNIIKATKIFKINENQEFFVAYARRIAETPPKYAQATNNFPKKHQLYKTTNSALANKIQSETYKESKINQFSTKSYNSKMNNQFLPI
jgi:hypothetical protein